MMGAVRHGNAACVAGGYTLSNVTPSQWNAQCCVVERCSRRCDSAVEGIHHTQAALLVWLLSSEWKEVEIDVDPSHFSLSLAKTGAALRQVRCRDVRRRVSRADTRRLPH